MIPWIMHRFWWPILRAMCVFFLHLKPKHKERLLNLKGPLLITANHLSGLDPYLIGLAVPFNAKIHPIRWLGKDSLFKYPVIKHFFLAFGTVPVNKGLGLKRSLEMPIKILKKGGAVGIFPQGKRVLRGRPPKARRGVIHLAKIVKCPILPVRISGSRNLDVLKVILRKNHVAVSFGKPYLLSAKIKSPYTYEKAADIIMEEIKKI